ncbi:MAG: hypothetical protein LBH37_00755 [Oscillospiraceae bacterium]|jgi:hypothetical protein|nr:hypothetical protein [Oscillospiraceae bacterium]
MKRFAWLFAVLSCVLGVLSPNMTSYAMKGSGSSSVSSHAEGSRISLSVDTSSAQGSSFVKLGVKIPTSESVDKRPSLNVGVGWKW